MAEDLRLILTLVGVEDDRETNDDNFPNNWPVAGDIRDVDATAIPEHDVMVAGFPCQLFSIAGVSKKNGLGRLHGLLAPQTPRTKPGRSIDIL